MRSTALEAVFCDLDGTLVDTAVPNHRAYEQALSEVGVPFPWRVFVGTWGRNSAEFLPEIAPQLRPEQIRWVRDEKARIYSKFLSELRVNGPLCDLLSAFKGQAPLALVTTAKRGNVNDVFAAAGLTGLFDHVVSGDDVTRGKPAPDAYLTALRLAGTTAARCVTFEDSDAGLAAARAAGIPAVRVVFP